MSETKKLSPSREAWLRRYIPQWADLRDRAVAAGLVEPEAPVLTDTQATAVAAIASMRERVVRRLAKPGNEEHVLRDRLGSVTWRAHPINEE